MVFGELGLIKDLNRREATVVALKEVELLWVTKDDFAEILEEEALTDFNDRKHRFSKDRFWAQFGPIGINNLVKTAQSFEVPAETMIFAEGDIASFVYFICDGDCRMAKVFSFEKIPVSPDSKEFKLRKYTGNPLSAPKQNRLVHKLISFSSVRRGAVFGAASVLAMAGTANQLATMRTMCDVSALTPFPFSLVTKTRRSNPAACRHQQCSYAQFTDSRFVSGTA
ncbi:hypothetical protein BC830DRAFT_1086984 [Chytriomyces sp. MP71]|nr:hypothetical protein BC830DRAFT_1086984 [Chytriomyces sp. MP71]